MKEMLNVLVGFLPWIVFSLIAGPSLWRLHPAIIVALVLVLLTGYKHLAGDAVKGKSRFVFLIVVLAVFFCSPLLAQLEEAVKVPWPGFQVLKGRWQSPNVKGAVEIKNIDPAGRMEVLFFNPEPIHVIKAQAAQDGKTTKVLIELCGAGSPCCTYDLIYDSGSDRLTGVYWLRGHPKTTGVIFFRSE